MARTKSGVQPRVEATTDEEARTDTMDAISEEAQAVVDADEAINDEVEVEVDELASDISNFKVALDNLVDHNNELIRTLAKRNKSTYRLVEARRHLQTIQRMLKPL